MLCFTSVSVRFLLSFLSFSPFYFFSFHVPADPSPHHFPTVIPLFISPLLHTSAPPPPLPCILMLRPKTISHPLRHLLEAYDRWEFTSCTVSSPAGPSSMLPYSCTLVVPGCWACNDASRLRRLAGPSVPAPSLVPWTGRTSFCVSRASLTCPHSRSDGWGWYIPSCSCAAVRGAFYPSCQASRNYVCHHAASQGGSNLIIRPGTAGPSAGTPSGCGLHRRSHLVLPHPTPFCSRVSQGHVSCPLSGPAGSPQLQTRGSSMPLHSTQGMLISPGVTLWLCGLHFLGMGRRLL